VLRPKGLAPPVSTLEITIYNALYTMHFKLGLIFYLLNNSPSVKLGD
jgi:hypothetical protein